MYVSFPDILLATTHAVTLASISVGGIDVERSVFSLKISLLHSYLVIKLMIALKLSHYTVTLIQ